MSPIDYYTKEERKVNGVFYTPMFLSEYLAIKVLKYYGRRKISAVFDPACGDSVLLRSFAHMLLNRSYASLPCIYGIDNDRIAIRSSISKFNENKLKIFKTHFINTDGLFPTIGNNSNDDWAKLRKAFKCNDGFDIGLSNPPWGTEIIGYDPNILNLNFVLAKGQYDIYDLFVEVILNNLNQNGIYGLILPDSVFSQEQIGLRHLLLNKTTIHLIARLGEKLFPGINRACVIIVGRKAKAKSNHLVDCFRLSSYYKKKIILNELALDEAEKDLLHKVPQSRFYKNENYVFDIDLKINEEKTFYKIQSNSLPLNTYVNNTRGAEISKKGIVVQCITCKQWMPYPKSKQPKCNNCFTILDIVSIRTEKIIVNHNGKGNRRLKVGEDLYRFTSNSKYWINTLKKGINYKDLNIYNGDKILVRKTGIGITACLDYDNAITNQVVYILKLKPTYRNLFSLEFILAVLNSRAMTYYLINKYGENEWKSHPYLTQTMLINLPFPKIDFNSIVNRNLINRVTHIVRKEVSKSKEKNISKKNDIYIERVIAYFFRLKNNDYNVIFKTLNSAEQLVPIKRLVNCNTQDIFRINGF